MVFGVSTGKIKATNKPYKDDWVFAITVRNGKVTKIQEYIDTQAPGAGLGHGHGRVRSSVAPYICGQEVVDNPLAYRDTARPRDTQPQRRFKCTTKPSFPS